MIIYYINFLAFSLLALIPWIKFSKKISFYYKIFVIVYLFIFLATRIDVGGDYQNLNQSFSVKYFSYGKNDAFSILPIILDGGILVALRGLSNQIVGNIIIMLSWLGLEYRFFIFFSSFIFLFGFFTLFAKNKNFFFITAISCSWYILVIGMGYMRQSISMGLVMLSIYFIVYKNKFFISIIFVCLSLLFHSSALLFLLFYIFFIKRKYFKFFILFVIFMIITLTVLFYPKIFSIFATAEQSKLKFLRIFMHLPSLFFIIFYWQDLKNSFESKLYQFYGFICILIIPILIIYIVGEFQSTLNKDAFIFVIYDRLLITVIPIQFLLISSIINLQKKNVALYLKSSLLIIYFMSLHLWFIYSWNSKSWVPYKSILFLE